MSESSFLEFRECVGCGELFPIRSPRARRTKWCSDHCRKSTLYGGECIGCGARTDGSNGRGLAPLRCVDCDRALLGARTRELYRKRQEPKRRLALALLAEGRTNQQIADALGMTKGSAQVLISRLRAYGYDVRRPAGRGRPPKLRDVDLHESERR